MYPQVYLLSLDPNGSHALDQSFKWDFVKDLIEVHIDYTNYITFIKFSKVSEKMLIKK